MFKVFRRIRSGTTPYKDVENVLCWMAVTFFIGFILGMITFNLVRSHNSELKQKENFFGFSVPSVALLGFLPSSCLCVLAARTSNAGKPARSNNGPEDVSTESEAEPTVYEDDDGYTHFDGPPDGTGRKET